MDLVGRGTPVRLTEDELKGHPLMRAIRSKGCEVPFRGLLGASLTDASGAGQGLIMVSDKNESDFAPEDETLLSQFAGFASLGLQHIQARIEAEQWAGEVAPGARRPGQARPGTDRRVERGLRGAAGGNH